MKDLLTSFFVLDLDGGKINAVLYDTKDPLSKQLEGILINVPEKNALSRSSVVCFLASSVNIISPAS